MQKDQTPKTADTFVACFTGHRYLSPEALQHLPRLLDETLTELIQSGFDTFRAGGALGFDTLAALKVLELKSLFPHIQLHLFLPCRDQDTLWNEDEKQLYQRILAHADQIHYTTEQYCDGCMLERNRQMIDGSHLCIAYCHSVAGGSGYSVKYARQQGVLLLNLAEQIPEQKHGKEPST